MAIGQIILKRGYRKFFFVVTGRTSWVMEGEQGLTCTITNLVLPLILVFKSYPRAFPVSIIGFCNFLSPLVHHLPDLVVEFDAFQ